MMVTAVDVLSLSPADRPPIVKDIIAVLTKALAEVPDGFEPILAIEADGTLRVIYYREVTSKEKLASFVAANPDITKDDLMAVAKTTDDHSTAADASALP